jgi:hypothetical protein
VSHAWAGGTPYNQLVSGLTQRLIQSGSSACEAGRQATALVAATLE